MLGVFLTVVGLICIIISLIYINKICKKEESIYEEIIIIHKDIKDNFFAIDNTINSFYDLVETSLDKVNNIESKPINYIQNSKIVKKTNEEKNQKFKKNILNNSEKIGDSDMDLYYKIKELKNIGLSNEEIAKKFKKGIREVEIILKMWGNI